MAPSDRDSPPDSTRRSRTPCGAAAPAHAQDRLRVQAELRLSELGNHATVHPSRTPLH